MEDAKDRYSIEDYSVGQTSLEQVYTIHHRYGFIDPYSYWLILCASALSFITWLIFLLCWFQVCFFRSIFLFLVFQVDIFIYGFQVKIFKFKQIQSQNFGYKACQDFDF